MSRIFEALKKARALGGAAGAPVPVPVHPLPAAGAAAGPALTWVEPPALSDERAQEMSSLRVGLESALAERASRAVLFVGAQGGEGTTTVVAEFAAFLAAHPGQRVLLLEVNAMRPVLGDRVAAGAGDHGSAWGGGRAGSGPAAGRLALAPLPESARRGGRLHMATVREWIPPLADQFDWVLLDAAPVLEAAESVDLAALADGVVIVVEAGRSKRPVLTRAVDLLRKGGARVLGTVLNRRRMEIPDFLYRRI